MAFFILVGIVLFFIFGVFPIVIMTYATIRDKREKRSPEVSNQKLNP